jgi:hypothetical protein
MLFKVNIINFAEILMIIKTKNTVSLYMLRARLEMQYVLPNKVYYFSLKLCGNCAIVFFMVQELTLADKNLVILRYFVSKTHEGSLTGFRAALYRHKEFLLSDKYSRIGGITALCII